MRTSGAIIALALCLPRSAAAQDALAFTWIAPPECPSRDDVVARVGRLRPALVRAASILRATATVTPSARGRWRVRVRTEVDADVGERVLEGRTCAQLADATAVVLALAADSLPDAAPATDHPTLPESVIQVEDAESALPRPVRPPPPPVPVHRWVDLGLDAAIDPLTFAAPAVQLALHGAIDRGALRVELALAQQLPTTLRGARAGTGAELLATTVTARACAMRVRSVVSVGLCAAATGGVMWGAAFGLQRNDVAVWPWVTVGAGGALRIALGSGRLAVIAHLEGVAPVTRPRFVVEGVGVTAEVPAFALFASLGLEARLP